MRFDKIITHMISCYPDNVLGSLHSAILHKQFQQQENHWHMCCPFSYTGDTLLSGVYISLSVWQQHEHAISMLLTWCVVVGMLAG